MGLWCRIKHVKKKLDKYNPDDVEYPQQKNFLEVLRQRRIFCRRWLTDGRQKVRFKQASKQASKHSIAVPFLPDKTVGFNLIFIKKQVLPVRLRRTGGTFFGGGIF